MRQVCHNPERLFQRLETKLRHYPHSRAEAGLMKAGTLKTAGVQDPAAQRVVTFRKADSTPYQPVCPRLRLSM